MGDLVSTTLWFFLLCLLMLALHEMYGPLLRKKVFKILILPGLAALLAFKMLCCVIVGAKIQDTKLFDDDKDVIHYGEPSIGWPGHFVIAVVPFFSVLLLFCIIHSLLQWAGAVPEPLPDMAWIYRDPGRFFSVLFSFFGWFFTDMWRHGLDYPALWIVLGLGVNVILALAPTTRDFKYIALAVGLLFGVGLLLRALGLGLTRRTETNTFLLRYVEAMEINVRFLLGLAGLWLAGSLVTVGAWRAFRTSQDRRDRKKK